ncbi:MAG TPA: flagellar biosynthesis anti-sigma factor FlgM [Blastocatellia bacterium]|nr:flagellar biosynthesis anti-sigma factor FlgM [Blastocatellia bacterium]
MNSVHLHGTNEIELVRTTLRPEAGRDGEGTVVAHPETGHPAPTAEGIKDVIKVSDRATAIRKLVEQVSRLPEVRAERVEQLRLQVQAGTYNPDATTIAEALFRNE